MPRIHISGLAKFQYTLQRSLRFRLVTFRQRRDDLDVRDIGISRKNQVIRIVTHAAPVMSRSVECFQYNRRKEGNLLPLFQYPDMISFEHHRVIMIFRKIQFRREQAFFAMLRCIYHTFRKSFHQFVDTIDMVIMRMSYEDPLHLSCSYHLQYRFYIPHIHQPTILATFISQNKGIRSKDKVNDSNDMHNCLVCPIKRNRSSFSFFRNVFTEKDLFDRQKDDFQV